MNLNYNLFINSKIPNKITNKVNKKSRQSDGFFYFFFPIFLNPNKSFEGKKISKSVFRSLLTALLLPARQTADRWRMWSDKAGVETFQSVERAADVGGV
ncbi:MAG: hypothetical protein D8H97_18100, partial [Neisseria sp.]